MELFDAVMGADFLLLGMFFKKLWKKAKGVVKGAAKIGSGFLSGGWGGAIGAGIGMLSDRSARKASAKSEDKHYNYLDRTAEESRGHQKAMQEAGFTHAGQMAQDSRAYQDKAYARSRADFMDDRKYDEGRYEKERGDYLTDRGKTLKQDRQFATDTLADKFKFMEGKGLTPWEAAGSGGSDAPSGPGGPIGAGAAHAGKEASSRQARQAAGAQQSAAEAQQTAAQIAGSAQSHSAQVSAEGALASARAGAAANKFSADKSYNANVYGTRLQTIMEALSQKTTRHLGEMDSATKIGGMLLQAGDKKGAQQILGKAADSLRISLVFGEPEKLNAEVDKLKQEANIKRPMGTLGEGLTDGITWGKDKVMNDGPSWWEKAKDFLSGEHLKRETQKVRKQKALKRYGGKFPQR